MDARVVEMVKHRAKRHPASRLLAAPLRFP
jgi:hypothetical protein